MQSLYTASLLGSVAFALSGFLVGVRKQLDLMGIFILAFITANGGGVIRDLLIGRPLVLVRDAEAFFITGGVLLIATVLRLHRLPQLESSWYFVVSDGIGLVAFGLTGSLIGIEAHTHFFGVLTLSLLTAIGGSVLRDLLVNEVPEVLYGGFYGTVALLQGAAIYALNATDLLNPFTLLLVFSVALAVRLIAYKLKWQLPKLTLG